MDWNRELMEKPLWKEEIKNREQKEAIARKIAKRVQNGDVIGFGSGSTSYLTVIEIAKKCEEENIKITTPRDFLTFKGFVDLKEYEQIWR